MTFIAGITLTDEEFTSQQAIEADLATQPQQGDLHNWLLLHNVVQCEPAIEKEGFLHIAELRELQSIKDLAFFSARFWVESFWVESFWGLILLVASFWVESFWGLILLGLILLAGLPLS